MTSDGPRYRGSSPRPEPDIGWRFDALDTALREHEALWRPRPFHGGAPAWQAMHPELHAWLCARSDADVEALEADADALALALSRFVPALAALPDLVALPAVDPPAHEPAVPVGFEWGIDGRKWAQVRAFAHAVATSGCDALAAVPRTDGTADRDDDTPARAHARADAHAEWNADAQPSHFVDWCAGKAHLARWLAHSTGASGLALEANAHLVAAGNALARKRNLPVLLHAQDVLAADAARHLGTETHAVALHACGRLHLHLLRLAPTCAVPRISISPCCHHLCDDDDTAISAPGRASPLQLAADELHLAVQETVTSGRSRQRQRAQESAWRLGFDTLQRQLRGVDAYLPVPSAPRALLRARFQDFVLWAAARKQLALPATLRLEALEADGWRRHAEVSRLALLRHAFRRVLELRIVFDRAHYLQAQGYDVRVRTFCARTQTPRNLLLEGRRWRR